MAEPPEGLLINEVHKSGTVSTSSASPLVPTTTPRCSFTNGDPDGSAEHVAHTPTETQEPYTELASRDIRLMGATSTSNSEVPTHLNANEVRPVPEQTFQYNLYDHIFTCDRS